MKKFLQYIAEAAEAKLKHITHLEDHHIDDGHEGFSHAVNVLSKVKKHLSSNEPSHDLTVKFDGSPSIVYGHHPETGKFFVASKSAFNKDPKINYNEADIERNHGHAPGLVAKLKEGLKHLPKIAPAHGVFQGDVMHTPEDHKHNNDGSVSFKPNTITYTAHGAEAETVKKSKFGIVTHTQYHGKDFESMRAEPIKSHKDFGVHSDVHQISPQYVGSGKGLARHHSTQFDEHLAAASERNKNTNHEAIAPYRAHINTYINSTVRENTRPTYEGLKSHIQKKSQKEIDSVKTEKSKQAKQQKLNSDIEHLDNHAESFKNALNAHEHLQAAKNILVKHMNKEYSGFEHSIGDKKSNPEGFVASHKGQLSKLVDRHEFSAANFGNKG